MVAQKTENKHPTSLALPILCLLTLLGCRPPAATVVQARYLMGTICTVTADGPDSLRCVRAVDRAFEAMREVDRLMSTYRPESPISHLNRAGHEGWVETPPPLFRVIASACKYSRLSGGAFDVTVGPLVRLWGFFDKKGRLPSPEEEAKARPHVGYRHILLDSARTAVRFDRPGVEIDLGGIAKGYALDRAAEALRAEGIASAVVDAGGNLIVLGGPASVGVAHPLNQDSLLCRVEVRDEAISTSGSSENAFLSDGRRYSHIFDPRTGRPVSGGLLSVTVVAPAGMASDALSTAAFVMGPEEGMALIEGMKGVGALFVSEAPDRPTGLDVRVSSRLKGKIF